MLLSISGSTVKYTVIFPSPPIYLRNPKSVVTAVFSKSVVTVVFSKSKKASYYGLCH